MGLVRTMHLNSFFVYKFQSLWYSHHDKIIGVHGISNFELCGVHVYSTQYKE